MTLREQTETLADAIRSAHEDVEVRVREAGTLYVDARTRAKDPGKAAVIRALETGMATACEQFPERFRRARNRGWQLWWVRAYDGARECLRGGIEARLTADEESARLRGALR